jgi:cell fate regulator YaaT (PSP1 superfamily)
MYRKALIEMDDEPRQTCYAPPGLAIHNGDNCILQAERVLEYGRVISLEDVDEEYPKYHTPEILRCATLQDTAKKKENELSSKMAMETVLASATKFELPMRIVSVRYSFDRQLVLVVFTADGRIDFRGMVRDLAGELHARIEMRQIGVRDEAAMVGGIGPCGRKMCCATWLNHFESINVKMAKTQRLSLNPTAISGMCGRLKCCLRYENEQYKECSRGMPRDGAFVDSPDGRGRVVDQNVMMRRVRVQLEDGHQIDCPIDDVCAVPGGGGGGHVPRCNKGCSGKGRHE